MAVVKHYQVTLEAYWRLEAQIARELNRRYYQNVIVFQDDHKSTDITWYITFQMSDINVAYDVVTVCHSTLNAHAD